MAVHDEYGRRTPYEMLLPDPEWPGRHFPGIEEEARQRGLDPWNPAVFVTLGATAGALSELLPEEGAAGAVQDHGIVLFFAFHLWRTGVEVALVRARTLKELLEGPEASPEDWTPGLLSRAGYIQLPQHLVWVHGEGGDAPESADGLFWAVGPGGVLHLTVAVGIRAGRPGLSVVPVPPHPIGTMDEWAAEPAREDGEEFATSLPGAELDGLMGLSSPAEVFKLAAVLLRAVAKGGGRPEEVPASPRSPNEPLPTELPYTVL